MLQFGCIADDYTGASDIASFIAKGGLRTILVNGDADLSTIPEDSQAVVVALKIRTCDPAEAKGQAVKKFIQLKELGAKTLYYKYCSTFDCTRLGNIGVVADAVMEEMGFQYTVLCPSLPVNGRTVRNGVLYVNEIPLSKSSMRFHPITPMWDSSLSVLMSEQSRYPVFNVAMEELLDAAKWKEIIDGLKGKHAHFYLVPDYYEDRHAFEIVSAFRDLRFFTGGSGLGTALAKKMVENGLENNPIASSASKADGDTLLLAGSCSAMTRAQVADYILKGNMTMRLEPAALMDDECGYLNTVITFMMENRKGSPLIYSSTDPDQIEIIQKKYGVHEISERIEQFFARIAEASVNNGFKKLIIAGGETSSAAIQKLGFSMFKTGASVASGVPVLTPLNDPSMRIILKSGNFGSKDFFTTALEIISGRRDRMGADN